MAVLAVLTAWLGAEPAAAEVPNLGAWSQTCRDEAGGRRCTLLQTIVSKEGGSDKRVLTVLVRPDVTGTEVLMLALPHGLFLPAGAELGVDAGAVHHVEIRTSDENGAYAGTTLTPELLAQMRGGKTLTVAFKAVDEKPVALAVPLDGFAPAYDRMKAEGDGAAAPQPAP